MPEELLNYSLMKWFFQTSLGSFVVETTLGWTYHTSRMIMNWSNARKFCQKTYTDMVVIQSQEENDYLVSKLPNRTSSPYYWIGITKNHKDDAWTWIGNNSTWIGEQSWALNEPNNNHATEFCVEIYVNHRENRGKWNDEKCSNRKFPVCFKGTGFVPDRAQRCYRLTECCPISLQLNAMRRPASEDDAGRPQRTQHASVKLASRETGVKKVRISMFSMTVYVHIFKLTLTIFFNCDCS